MTGQQWLAIAFAVGMLAWQFWPGLSKLRAGFKLPSFSFGTGNAAAAPPTAAEAFTALTILARFKDDSQDDPMYAALVAAWRAEAP